MGLAFLESLKGNITSCPHIWVQLFLLQVVFRYIDQ